MRKLLDLMRFVRWRDILDLWKLPVALLLAPFCRRKRRDLWIVSEDPMEARDNGLWFFRYVRTEHPEQPCVYAIRPDAPDYGRAAALGETVAYGSLRHWVLYLASAVQISSQKSGDPNAPIFYFLQVYGLLKNKRVFLQHGVTVSDPDWLYFRETRISRFLCGAAPEYAFVRDRFGYPEGSVRYTGLCRFDGLHAPDTDPKTILIMPTWRNWLVVRKDKLKALEGVEDVAEAQYFACWRAFLADGALRDLGDTYGVRFLFYPHRNMQPYLDLFPTDLPHVEICSREDYDVQDLLKRAALLVTDYSSVFFDMIYMQKPVIFYQFDYDTFRKGQYRAGWFDYGDNPFGPSCREKEQVFTAVRQAIEDGYRVSPAYLAAHGACFPLYDENNCRRTFDVVRKLSEETTHG